MREVGRVGNWRVDWRIRVFKRDRGGAELWLEGADAGPRGGIILDRGPEVILTLRQTRKLAKLILEAMK